MNKRFFCRVSTLAMILLGLPLLMLSAQSGPGPKSFSGEVMDSICAPSGSHAAEMAKMPSMGTDSETCTKKCSTMGAKLMLYDDASHTAYSIDDPTKLAQLAGHKVRVTGRLTGNTIKVSDVDQLS